MMTSPPSPPSPPDGPPRGTYFSRRKARQPLPPSPAFTRIVASSINIRVGFSLWTFVSFVVDAFKCLNHKGHEGTQRKTNQATKKPRPEGEAVWRGRPRPRDDSQLYSTATGSIITYLPS